MTTEDIKILKIGDIIYHDISEHFLKITDISWKVRQSNDSEIIDPEVQTEDIAQKCQWTITQPYLEHYHIAPEDFDYDAYVRKCQSKRFCQCCGVSEDEMEELDEHSICGYCKKQKRLFHTAIRKSAHVDLGEFNILGHKGDFMELTEWTNGEGFDLYIYKENKDLSIQLSDDELLALFNLATSLGFTFHDFSKIQK